MGEKFCIRTMARSYQPIPDDIGRASVDWVRRDRLLVVEEVRDLEDGAGPLVGLDQVLVSPRLAAVTRSSRRDAGVVVAAATDCTLCR